MKVHYDKQADALYIQLSDEKPDGVIEVSNEVHIDTTPEGKIVGIEILDTSKKIDLSTILTYEIDAQDLFLQFGESRLARK